jgi:hypothetical protein
LCADFASRFAETADFAEKVVKKCRQKREHALPVIPGRAARASPESRSNPLRWIPGPPLRGDPE